MNNYNLSTIEINPSSTPQASIIWLHGLGADGHDFEPIAQELKLPTELGVRFVFPHAPIRSVTINNGMRMRAWYDIQYANAQFVEDEAGIRESGKAIHKLIEEEQNRGVDSRKIILAGFSQGGAIALYTGLRSSKPLGGIIALSTYLPLAEQIKSEFQEANQSIPIFMAHGTQDSVIPIDAAHQSKNFLNGCGYTVDWIEYKMPHSVCPVEIEDIRQWLIGLLT